jgi:hypothetical protein
LERLRTGEGNIALFTHGHFGRVLAARWIGLPLIQANSLVLNTGSLSILGFEHQRVEEPAILLWNSTTDSGFAKDSEKSGSSQDSVARKRAIERWETEGGRILEANPSNSPIGDRRSRCRQEGADCAVIRMHLRRWEQLFDSLDDSPFREKDLDRNAEEYIVESFQELPSRRICELVIHMDQPLMSPEEERVFEDAVRVHFARRAEVRRRALRPLLRRGWISLAIGLTCMVALFVVGQFTRQLMGDGHLADLIRESLLIGGWVAMWRPLEILLYDWWPLVGERRLYERLSNMNVRIVHA